MKDVHTYPKTLRNYDEEKDSNRKKLTFAEKNNLERKNVYLSTFSPRQNIIEQDHYVTDYHTLTNTSELINKKTKKSKTKKSKSKSKESHLSHALKQNLSNKAIAFQQIGPQSIVHCKSLEKLQIISNDRSEEIKALITEKAMLIAENEDLKAKLSNPTYREQEFIQKIVKKDLEIENLRETLLRKDEKIVELEKEHKLEIERLKKNFQEQLTNLRGEVSMPKVEKRRDSQKVYYTQTTSNEVNPVRQIVQAASYEIEPTSVNTIGSGIYKISHSNDYSTSRSPVVVHSTNKSSYSPIQEKSYSNQNKEVTVSHSTQQFQTYVGEDGFERRVYYRNPGVNNVESFKQEPEKIRINSPYQENQTYKYSSDHAENSASQGYGTFTNAKISSYVSKEPEKIQISRESSSSENQHHDDFKLHNENLYSKSLTFQCFNDES